MSTSVISGIKQMKKMICIILAVLLLVAAVVFIKKDSIFGKNEEETAVSYPPVTETQVNAETPIIPLETLTAVPENAAPPYEEKNSTAQSGAVPKGDVTKAGEQENTGTSRQAEGSRESTQPKTTKTATAGQSGKSTTKKATTQTTASKNKGNTKATTQKQSTPKTTSAGGTARGGMVSSGDGIRLPDMPIDLNP